MGQWQSCDEVGYIYILFIVYFKMALFLIRTASYDHVVTPVVQAAVAARAEAAAWECQACQ